MLSWDVLNGVGLQGQQSQADFNTLLNIPVMCHQLFNLNMQLSRRSWSGHPLAKETVCAAMATQPKLRITIPHEVADSSLIDQVVQD